MVDARSRMGLCLSGGGVTGAMYQVGCLAALEDRIEGFAASEFDVFMGTGSGATVALALASGLNVQRMYRALLDPADDFFPLQRNHLLRMLKQENVTLPGLKGDSYRVRAGFFDTAKGANVHEVMHGAVKVETPEYAASA